MTYYAEISWENDIPVSQKFGDVYFSKASGLEETRYVFHKHNYLEERFAKLTQGEAFTIGETGFGSGLNFLATVQLWHEKAITDAKLHYISIEKYPLQPKDLAKILSYFPELEAVSNTLINQYYLPLPAMHRISLAHNVELTLIVDDIKDALPKINSKVDAWFLDGFSPAKNSDMWDEEIFHQLSRLSKQTTTYATFTSSSIVRKALLAAGFSVNKTKGFAFKREMIYGTYLGSSPKSDQPSSKRLKTWLSRPVTQSMTKQAIIIGAGISGAATAYSLAKRGYRVTVYEKNPEAAMEASGNHQGMLYGSWSAFPSPMMELSHAGYRYSHALIRKFLQANKDYAECGLIQLGYNEEQIKRQQQLLKASLPDDFIQAVDAKEIEALIGQDFCSNLNGIYFPSGMWLKPARLVNALLDNPLITLKLNSEISSIDFIEHKWHIYSNNNLIDSSPILILANAHAVNNFKQTKHLPLRKIRGQISLVTEEHSVNSVLCGDGYLTPAIDGKYTIGASFIFEDESVEIRENEHHENINRFRTVLPKLISRIKIDNLNGQVNFRTSPHDYLPLLGPVADFVLFRETYARLAIDRKARITTPCPYLPNLFINIGHGAKGILTAPICGEILADYIDNTPMPCSEELRQAIHPNRLYAKLVYTESPTN